MPSTTNSGCATFDPSLLVHVLPLQQPSATHCMPLKCIAHVLIGDQLRPTLYNAVAVVIGASNVQNLQYCLSWKTESQG
jgi:invasion protein IalB